MLCEVSARRKDTQQTGAHRRAGVPEERVDVAGEHDAGAPAGARGRARGRGEARRPRSGPADSGDPRRCMSGAKAASLREYEQKRDFGRTPEPGAGGGDGGEGDRRRAQPVGELEENPIEISCARRAKSSVLCRAVGPSFHVTCSRRRGRWLSGRRPRVCAPHEERFRGAAAWRRLEPPKWRGTRNVFRSCCH